MHISTCSGNVNYHSGSYRMRYFLNNVEVTQHCCEANEEAGFYVS